MGSEDLVPEYTLAVERKPRMPAFDRLLHFQAGVQAQILREDLRGMHGVLLLITAGGYHEQAIFVHTWRAEPRIAYPGRPQSCKQMPRR